MPSPDRRLRPRRRASSATADSWPKLHAEIRAAAGDEARQAEIRPRLVRWLIDRGRDADTAASAARAYLRKPHLMPMLPPGIATPDLQR